MKQPARASEIYAKEVDGFPVFASLSQYPLDLRREMASFKFRCVRSGYDITVDGMTENHAAARASLMSGGPVIHHA